MREVDGAKYTNWDPLPERWDSIFDTEDEEFHRDYAEQLLADSGSNMSMRFNPGIASFATVLTIKSIYPPGSRASCHFLTSFDDLTSRPLPPDICAATFDPTYVNIGPAKQKALVVEIE